MRAKAVPRGMRVLAALLLLALVTPLATAVAAEETVVIANKLKPKQLAITPGTTVTWVNEDDERHRMRSEDGPEDFDSGNLDPGESFSFNFAIEGVYTYIDDRNEDATAYHGTITVTADAPPPAPGEPAPPPPTSGDVSIGDRVYLPPSITVGVGATVTWANNDTDEHTVTATDNSWDSGIFNTGGTYSRTFDTAGTHPYFCIIHPDMTGTVTVVADGGGEPAPPPGEDPAPPPPEEDPPPPPPPAAGDVNIFDFGYGPSTLTVGVGSTVTFSNSGAAPHTVTQTGGGFDSGFLFAGDTYQRTFGAAGTFDYFCTLHPEMTGTVIVAGAAGDPAPDPGGDPAPDPGGDPAPDPSSGGGTPAPAPSAPSGAISIVDNGYSPASRTVTTGTTVVWANTGQLPHTVTQSGGGFDSGFLVSGATYSRTFTEPGSFAYFCTIHPEMTGTITVTGAATGEAPSDSVDPGESGGVDPDQAEAGGSTAAPAGASGVSIIDNGYTPGTTTISAGQSVSWVNTGALPHTVTARSGEFDSGFLNAGDGYSRRFVTPGTYDYFCTLHPEMSGTVIVTEATEPIDTSGEDEVRTTADGADTESDAADGGPTEGGVAASADEAAPVVARNVRVVDNDYEPGTVTVEAGQAVRFANAGLIPHTVTARDGSFDSGFMDPGASYQQVFLEVGTYEYWCTIHPEMVGVVEVVAPAPEVVTAGVGGVGTSGTTDPAVAFILAGSIVVAVGAMAFGMARFAQAAKDAR